MADGTRPAMPSRRELEQAVAHLRGRHEAACRNGWLPQQEEITLLNLAEALLASKPASDGYEVRRARADRHAAYVQGCREAAGLTVTGAETWLIADGYMAGEEAAEARHPAALLRDDAPTEEGT